MENSPLVEGLLRIHKVISRGLNTSILKCDEYYEKGGIPPEEAEGFHTYLKALRWVTHSHHLSEDEIAFPYFSGTIKAPYPRLRDDHHAINLIMEKLDKYLSEPSDLVDLRSLLYEFDSVWGPHIKIEEDNFNEDKLKSFMGMKEQLALIQRLGEHGRKNLGPGPITLPFLFYNLEGRDREEFMTPIPWVIKKVLIPVVWRKQWNPMRPFLLTDR
jgi:Hemerythrin HHE cation binding domain